MQSVERGQLPAPSPGLGKCLGLSFPVCKLVDFLAAL